MVFHDGKLKCLSQEVDNPRMVFVVWWRSAISVWRNGKNKQVYQHSLSCKMLSVVQALGLGAPFWGTWCQQLASLSTASSSWYLEYTIYNLMVGKNINARFLSLCHPCCQCFSSSQLANPSITNHLQTVFLVFLWLPAEGRKLHNKRQKTKNRSIPESFTKAFMRQTTCSNWAFPVMVPIFWGQLIFFFLHLITALPLHCSCLKTKRTVLDPWLLTSKPCKQQENVKSHSEGFCGTINNKHMCSFSCLCHTGLI